MSKALDAKHEKILKSLLRIPDNKRCINCDTLGPQYVVGELQIFVCTVCSGVHRQFSHRVKGISMSTFKPEEMKALEAGGNGVAAQVYLAKWKPKELQKPADRNTTKIKDWIDAVYVKKKFYSQEAASTAASRPSAQIPRRSISSTSSAGDEVPIVSMGNMLGDNFKLQVLPNHGHLVNGGNVRALSTTSSHSHGSPAPAHVTANLVNILDSPVKASQLKDSPPSEGWDAFAAPSAYQPQQQQQLPPVQEVPSWNAFDQSSTTAPAVPSPAPVPAKPSISHDASWSTFDGPVAQQPQHPSPQGHQQQQPQQQTQTQPQQQMVLEQDGAKPGQGPPQVQAAKPPTRQELPLDLFGDGLLNSYSAPPSITGQYGQAPRQPNFQYGQPAYQQQQQLPIYGQQPQYQQHPQYQQQPPFTQQQSFQQQRPYQQAPQQGAGLLYNTPAANHGQNAQLSGSRGGSLGGLDIAPRSSSDATGAGDASTGDPFSGLVSSFGGVLPSVSRHNSTSSAHSGQDVSSYGAIPSVSQPLGLQQTPQAGSGSNASSADAFAGNSYAPSTLQAYQAPAESAKPAAKFSGNPFA